MPCTPLVNVKKKKYLTYHAKQSHFAGNFHSIVDILIKVMANKGILFWIIHCRWSERWSCRK